MAGEQMSLGHGCTPCVSAHMIVCLCVFNQANEEGTVLPTRGAGSQVASLQIILLLGRV